MFQPGILVECVDATDTPFLVRGAIYTCVDVRSMGVSCARCRCAGNNCDQTGLMLAEEFPVFAGFKAGYVCSRAFRPLRQAKPDLIERLMASPMETV